MKSELLNKTVLILLLLVLIFGGLYFAAPFLKPLALALLIALLMLTVSRKFENKGANRLWSSILSMLIVIAFLASIFGLMAYQANQMSDNSEELEEKGKQKVEKLREAVSEKTGLTSEQIDSFLKNTGHSQLKSTAKNIGGGIVNSLTDLLLTLIYSFLLLYYRGHLKRFILKLIDKQHRGQAKITMEESGEIALQYLGAKFILIAILASIYAIGLTFLGVKYAIFYGVLAALLSLIPYIGNMIGAAFPLIMAIIYNDTTTAIGVVILFAAAQFIESYFLEPLIVGKKVNLNPMMTILIAVLGGILWGVPGMIIAIPYLGITAIIFNKIDELKPIAFLLSNGNND